MNAALGERDDPASRSVGRAARRPAARRLPAPASSWTGTRARSWTGSTCASPTRAHVRRARRHARRRALARCGSACPGCSRCRPATLAIIGDYVPFGIGQALGQRAGGNSLDNTLRVAQPRPDRVGARRHPRPRGRRRLRPRPRAPLGRGRHAARHRQPVHDRARLARRAAEHGPTATEPEEHADDRHAALRHHHPVRRRAAASSTASGSRSSSTSATPTSGRRGRRRTTRSRRSRSPRRGRPTLRLGTAIVPAYTRGPAHARVRRSRSLADAAPGRFALGIGTSSNVIVERWNGIPFEQAVPARPRHGPLPARRARGREGRPRSTRRSR